MQLDVGESVRSLCQLDARGTEIINHAFVKLHGAIRTQATVKWLGVGCNGNAGDRKRTWRGTA